MKANLTTQLQERFLGKRVYVTCVLEDMTFTLESVAHNPRLDSYYLGTLKRPRRIMISAREAEELLADPDRAVFRSYALQVEIN